MKSYAERHCFTQLQVDAWRRATDWVSRIRLPWEDSELRCHELVRAVAYGFRFTRHELVVVDGKCGIVEHSWLIWDSSRSDVGTLEYLRKQGRTAEIMHAASHGAILDVYTPGCVPQVQLIDSLMAFGRYLIGAQRDDIREDVVQRLICEMGLESILY